MQTLWVRSYYRQWETDLGRGLRSGERAHGVGGNVSGQTLNKILGNGAPVYSEAHHCFGCKHFRMGVEERGQKENGLGSCGVVVGVDGGEPLDCDGIRSGEVTCRACHNCCMEIQETDWRGHCFA